MTLTGIVDALKDSEWRVREDAINRLVEHCKYYHWSNLMCSTMTVAEFHDEIRIAIPGIMACLTDSAWRVRQAAINGLSSLAVYRMCYFYSRLTFLTMVIAEFHEEIQTVTTSIMECLKDPEWAVRRAAITGLSSVAARRMCYHLLPFDILNHSYS